MNFPEVSEVRNLIQKAKPQEAKYLFMTEYMLCARICELVSKKYASDVTTTPLSLSGKSVRQTVYRSGKEKHDVVVIEVKTAKRKGTTRYIALPLDKKYEPFTQELFDYLKQFGSDPCFPFTRQHAYLYARDAFKDLEYPIASYTPFKDKKQLPLVEEHYKPFRTHALRHLRATELIEFYDFGGTELSLYGGWSLRTMLGVSGAIERYAHLSWRKYFPKLLQERTNEKRGVKGDK